MILLSFSRSSVYAKGRVLTVYHDIDRELVHAFYDAALKHGGKSNGGPGVRPQYTRFYYAAFVFDPAGNNIETVCLWPAWCHWKYWFGMGVFGRQKTE